MNNEFWGYRNGIFDKNESYISSEPFFRAFTPQPLVSPDLLVDTPETYEILLSHWRDKVPESVFKKLSFSDQPDTYSRREAMRLARL
jgi:hypothetical protein